MAVRPRFSSVCIFIVVLEWASAAAASSPGAVAGPRALNAAGSHHGSASVEPTGPPPNLQSGVFRSVVHTMWQASPTFKQQCRRLAMAPGLVVRLLVDSSRGHSNLRAWTEMSRRDGALSNARVVILSPPDSTELIAHEIEHVIEQLDGVDVRDRRSSTTTHAAGVAYESDRAAHVGRVVAAGVTLWPATGCAPSLATCYAHHRPSGTPDHAERRRSVVGAAGRPRCRHRTGVTEIFAERTLEAPRAARFSALTADGRPRGRSR